MTDKELLLSAIANGREDDATISAALDAIREESDCTLIAAVLQVSHVHNARQNAHDISEATKHLAKGSKIKSHLKHLIENNCLNLPDGAFTTIAVVAGDAPPVAQDNILDSRGYVTALASITVGALWVKRAANQIMVERERAEANERFHRKGTTSARARRSVK